MNPSTFRSNLRTQLLARSGVSSLGAAVFAYAPGGLANATKPTLYFHEVSDVTQELQSYTSNVERFYRITGRCYAPSAGATDAKYATAESNAYTLINELSNQLVDDPTANGACGHARLETWNLAPTQDDSGAIFVDGEFTILVHHPS